MGRKRTEEEWEDWKFPYENKGKNSLQAYVIKRITPHKDIKLVKVMKANESGVSDLLFCVRGRFVAIELKIDNNTPTDLQKQFLEDVERAGGIVGVAYTWGEVKTILAKAGYLFDYTKEESVC